MRFRLGSLFLTAACVLASGVAFGQNQYESVDIFATGENPPLDAYNPGTSIGLQLLNDGTNGDTTATDAIWSRNVLITSAPATNNGRFQWKMASAGFSKEAPAGFNNAVARAVVGQTLKIVFDTTPKNDGFSPDAGSGNYTRGLVWTVPSPMTSTARVTGNFINKLGGSDWDAASTYTVMNDSGTSGDLVAGDGIYTYRVTGLPAGTYQYKYVIDGNFDYAVGAGGGWNQGGDINLSVSGPSDIFTFQLDVARGGRIKFSTSVPTSYYATSPKWSTNLDATTLMNDTGTNGDVTSGDGVYTRKFNTNAAGNDIVYVQSSTSGRWPSTGGYPIDIVTTGQAVLVQFDTNVKVDGYIPTTNYLWTDVASRNNAAAPVIVGAFTPIQFGLGGTGTYNNGNTDFRAYDDGSAATITATGLNSGDVTAGDKVFTMKVDAVANFSGVDWKAVANSGSWDTELGGQGFTRGIDNSKAQLTASSGQRVIFSVDGITGRIRSFVGTSSVTASIPSRPATINALAAPAGVSDWSIY